MTVLVIEHNQALLQQLVKFISQHGYRTFGASTVQQAINVYRENLVEVIVVDAETGNEKGYDIINDLWKKYYPSEAVVIITTHLTNTISAFRSRGIVRYFSLPIDFHRLEITLNELYTRVISHSLLSFVQPVAH